MSDECYKMALTDAISVAAKALGVAADVYYKNDRSKYIMDTITTEDPPADGLQPGEKMNLPPAGSWNPKNAIGLFCKRVGLKLADFANLRTALIAGGIVRDIPSGELSPVDFDVLCKAMEANYPELLKVSA